MFVWMRGLPAKGEIGMRRTVCL